MITCTFPAFDFSKTLENGTGNTNDGISVHGEGQREPGNIPMGLKFDDASKNEVLEELEASSLFPLV
jgi:hypothetical protein